MFGEAELARLLNEWYRRYTEEPEEYDNEMTTTKQFLREQSAGKTPSYGSDCAAYLMKLAAEMGMLDDGK